MEKDIYTEQFPGNPVLCDLKLSREEIYTLKFQSATKKNNRCGGMNGYTYAFNGRNYRDVDSLLAEQI